MYCSYIRCLHERLTDHMISHVILTSLCEEMDTVSQTIFWTVAAILRKWAWYETKYMRPHEVLHLLCVLACVHAALWGAVWEGKWHSTCSVVVGHIVMCHLCRPQFMPTCHLMQWINPHLPSFHRLLTPRVGSSSHFQGHTWIQCFLWIACIFNFNVFV